MSTKQEWLTKQSLKVHTAIDDNLEEWLKRVNYQYDVVFKTLQDELKKVIKEFHRSAITRDRLEARYTVLAMQAQQRANEIGLELAEQMPAKLKEYANLSYEGMNEILKKSNAFANSLPSYSIEFAAGYQYKEYNFQSSIFRSGIRLGDKLNSILSEGLAKGWNMAKYAKELKKVTDFTTYEANRIARTETARVANEGNKRAFREYGVERVEWVASLEKRTCERCAALHTKKFILGQEPPLPLHPHCRCVLVPVLEDSNVKY
ncbi:TPA: minor capsid protein [Bacillus paranthracis]|nr:minor capsid protein [Bacillus paranthracis]HDR7304491.1 minor capsid protein [Bacillus paranthracis]